MSQTGRAAALYKSRNRRAYGTTNGTGYFIKKAAGAGYEEVARTDKFEVRKQQGGVLALRVVESADVAYADIVVSIGFAFASRGTSTLYVFKVNPDRTPPVGSAGRYWEIPIAPTGDVFTLPVTGYNTNVTNTATPFATA